MNNEDKKTAEYEGAWVEYTKASFFKLGEVNGLKPYLITFTINGRKQAWIRYGAEMNAVLAEAEEIIKKEWNGVVKALTIFSPQYSTHKTEVMV
jgi:hypothetical protein